MICWVLSVECLGVQVGVWGAMAGCHDWVSTVLSGESGVYVALISKSLGRDLLWFFEASEELR